MPRPHGAGTGAPGPADLCGGPGALRQAGVCRNALGVKVAGGVCLCVCVSVSGRCTFGSDMVGMENEPSRKGKCLKEL